MSIKETVEKIISEVPVGIEFFYANMYEANLGLENFEGKDREWAVVYIPPLTMEDDLKNPAIKTKVPMYMFVLRKFSNPVSTYSSVEVDPTIDLSIAIARNIVHRLNKSDIIDTESERIVKVIVGREYAWSDLNLFGCSVKFDMPVQESKTGCYITP